MSLSSNFRSSIFLSSSIFLAVASRFLIPWSTLEVTTCWGVNVILLFLGINSEVKEIEEFGCPGEVKRCPGELRLLIGLATHKSLLGVVSWFMQLYNYSVLVSSVLVYWHFLNRVDNFLNRILTLGVWQLYRLTWILVIWRMEFWSCQSESQTLRRLRCPFGSVADYQHNNQRLVLIVWKIAELRRWLSA